MFKKLLNWWRRRRNKKYYIKPGDVVFMDPKTGYVTKNQNKQYNQPIGIVLSPADDKSHTIFKLNI